MQHATGNPIYERLTRSRRAPSDWCTYLTGAVSGAAGFLIAAMMVLAAGGPGGRPIIVLLCVGVGLAAVFLLAGCALAAGITARFASDRDHALLRLSVLYPEDIVTGYASGVFRQLRVLRAIGLWFPAGLLGADILLGNPAAALGQSQEPFVLIVLSYVANGIVCAMPLVWIEVLNFIALWRAGIDVGVWIGLRWAHEWQIAGGVVILVGLVPSIPLVAGLILYPSATLGLLICVGALMAMWAHRVAAQVSQVARSQAIRLIANQNTL